MINIKFNALKFKPSVEVTVITRRKIETSPVTTDVDNGFIAASYEDALTCMMEYMVQYLKCNYRDAYQTRNTIIIKLPSKTLIYNVNVEEVEE